jgi:hypothetical protein
MAVSELHVMSRRFDWATLGSKDRRLMADEDSDALAGPILFPPRTVENASLC